MSADARLHKLLRSALDLPDSVDFESHKGAHKACTEQVGVYQPKKVRFDPEGYFEEFMAPLRDSGIPHAIKVAKDGRRALFRVPDEELDKWQESGGHPAPSRS